MRRTLLTTAVILGLSLPAAARAQVITISPMELSKMADELSQLKQVYDTTLGTLGSLTRSLNPNSIAQNLIGSQPMPSMPNINGMLTGGGNFGALSGLANQFKSSNTYYTPQSTGAGDFSASMLSRNGNSLAGLQAMLATQMQSTQTHIAGVAQIQSQLSTANSQADLTAIQGRIVAEQANMQAQGVQINAITGMMTAQQQQYQLMADQRRRQSADCLLASVNGGGSCTTGTPTPASSTSGTLPGPLTTASSSLPAGGNLLNANSLSLN